MAQQALKYNPALLSEQDLIDGFVVRQVDLELILKVIRENTGPVNQHILVIGPRGAGKTTLLLRAATEIRRNSELNKRWYPLRFPEESYFVSSPGEFWLEALYHLAEQTGSEEWKKTYEHLREESDDERLKDRALAQLLDFSEREDKRLLLIVENMGMLLGKWVSAEGAWSIRHTLVNEERIMLLSSAVNRFDVLLDSSINSRFVDDIDNSDKAMFDMFRVLSLPPLGTEECNVIWTRITGESLDGEKIRPIQILTGGNPRLLTIVARFGKLRSFQYLLENLVSLVDEHTEYFKSHLDAMAPKECKVFLALADLWEDSFARDVARVARMPVNVTSALLQRLAERGAVTLVETGKRAKRYAVTERLYNIYHLMRRSGKATDRVNFAVRFMLALYGLSGTIRHLAREAANMEPEQCVDHKVALKEVMRMIPESSRRQAIFAELPEHFRIYLQETLPELQSEAQPPFMPAITLAEPLYSEDSAKSTIMEQAAKELYFTGLLFDIRDQHEEALAAYDKLISRYGHSTEPALMEQVAMTLDSKGYLLEEMGRHEDELAVYDELISRYGDSTEPALMKRVAKALFNKGYRFGEMGQHEDALAAYDKLLTRYGDNAESALMKQVTMALFNKGIQFGEMGQHEDALAAYVELIRRYGDSAEPALMERVAKALVNKGYRLGQMGQHEEELAAYDELLSRYGDSAETVLMEQVAKALGNKGYRLGQMGRHEDELATYNELISRYGDSTEPALMESIVNGLFNKGYRLKEMGRQEEAIAAYDELLNRYGNSTEPALMEQVATAFAYRASLRASILLSQNRFEKFSALTKEQLERYPENSRLHNVLAWAVYKHRARPFYLEAAGWATIAANISKNAEHYHTLACLLCIQGKGEEALAPAALYLADTTLVINRLEDAIDLFVGLAAAGQAKEALAMLEKSAAAPHLEPLLVGLRLYLSLEVTAAQEIREIGHDVVKRIETRKQEIA